MFRGLELSGVLFGWGGGKVCGGGWEGEGGGREGGGGGWVGGGGVDHVLLYNLLLTCL